MKKDLPARMEGNLAKVQEWAYIYVKKLCSKLGLKITIDSEVNKGTKVTLIFPLSSMITFGDD